MKSVFSLIVVLLSSFASARGQTAPPNIVVILADDLGYGDVSFNGCPDYSTPNIDSIATNGASCSDGYATHPFCSPSRAGLMTGRYQQRFGYENQPEDDPNNPNLGLPTTELTLAEILKPAGYVCGAIGKWHLGYASNLQPLSRGFDEFWGFLDAQSHYYDAKILDGTTTIVVTDYLTDAFTTQAVDFINRHAAAPFFLYLAYNAVHAPLQVPPQQYMDRVSYIADFDRQKYAAITLALDDGVGAVLQALTNNGVYNNTLIFFVSDNGPITQRFTRPFPLRGYKGNTLEGGIRVPYAVQWPGHVPPGTVYTGMVSTLDIMATAAAAAGVTLPSDRAYDGYDLVPYLSGRQAAPPRDLFWRWFDLGPDGPPGCERPIWAVRSGSLKLVVERDSDSLPPALYDLNADIGETTNLAALDVGDVETLQGIYNLWNLETIPPLWQGTQFPTNPLVLVGDWNGFDVNNAMAPWSLVRKTAPNPKGTPDNFTWFTSTLHVAANGGDTTPGTHTFVLVGDKTWAEQWGGVTIDIDAINPTSFYEGTALGPTNTITLSEGYYSWHVLDPLTDDFGPPTLNLGVFKTSAPPVELSWSGQTPAAPTAADPTVVSFTTTQPPSPEEKLYLRWTTDTFTDSTLVPAIGSGTTYSATIPPQPAKTLVQYTIVSSTADLAPYTKSGTIDALTLADTVQYRFVPTAVSPTPTPSPSPTPGFPTITTQPSDRTVNAGRSAKFRVTATGTAPLSYQWRKNASDIVGATHSSYTTPATTIADNGALFSVVVSNSAGSVISDDAKLTVNDASPPTITSQPANTTVMVGATARFRVTAVGSAPLHYQWKKNGVDILGATKNSYTTPPVTLDDNGSLFSVVVTNSAGSVTSSDAVLTVN
jgi:arylsulfatase A-like enzyme